MHSISETIFNSYQTRKTKKQKSEFIDFLLKKLGEEYPDMKSRVEQSKIIGSRNIICGDIERADVIFTAHYDTAAVLPFPNMIMPYNLFLSVMYSVLIVIPIIIVSVLISALGILVSDSQFVGFILSYVVIIAFLFIIFFGKVNKHTANDNTSGVITLCEIMASMSGEERSKAAFVFFDNEELGLFGSYFFAKSHAKEIEGKLIVNLDCVSDGDNIAVVYNKKLENAHVEKRKASFLSDNSKEVLISNSSKAFYPSDQMNFKTGVAVAALKKSKFLGLYLDRIHTKKDTVFDKANIELIVKSTLRLINLY